MSITWFKAALVRSVRTMAQTVVGMLPAAATIAEVDWQVVAGAALLAGFTSIMMSVAGLPEVKEENK